MKIDEAMEKFGGQIDSYLDDTLKNLEVFYPEEFDILRQVAIGDLHEISEYGREAPDLIDHLIGYDLITRRGDDFDIRYDTVKSALVRKFKTKDTEFYWTQCMIRRNRLETSIRNQLFFASKRLSSNEWFDIIKETLSTNRFEALRSTEPKVLFSQKSSPLYWTDLINFVRSEKVFLHLGSQKESIVKAMSKINFLGRSDSHAKKISELEFQDLDAAFSILEDEFAEPE